MRQPSGPWIAQISQHGRGRGTSSGTGATHGDGAAVEGSHFGAVAHSVDSGPWRTGTCQRH